MGKPPSVLESENTSSEELLGDGAGAGTGTGAADSAGQQFAASFATLVSPPTLGAVAVNARFLNRSGLPPAAAAATVGVSQVAAFIVHVSLLLVIGIAAGTQAELQFNPPRGVIIGIGITAMIIGGLASISHMRRWLTNRIRPMIEQIIPRLATVAQRPAKLAEGFGGILLLNVAYCLCLVASVRAFSDDLTIAAISFMYPAGSTLSRPPRPPVGWAWSRPPSRRG